MSFSAEDRGWACDTSVAIASLDPANPMHRSCRDAVLQKLPVLAGHASFESYSVLTRMPPPFRVRSEDAYRVLTEAFTGSCWLNPEQTASLWQRLPSLGILGGATYDALVAESARVNGFRLMTIDRRAERTYQVLGVDYWLIA